jgi:hypothetical protein
MRPRRLLAPSADSAPGIATAVLVGGAVVAPQRCPSESPPPKPTGISADPTRTGLRSDGLRTTQLGALVRDAG